MLRRLRAVAVTAILWALLWIPVGVVVALSRESRNDFINLFPVSAAESVKAVASYALEWGLLGAINGALFAVVLALAERRGSVDTLSVGRIAAWGGVATVTLPVLVLLILVLAFPQLSPTVEPLPLLGIVLLGAACGTAMLLVARRKTFRATSVRDSAA